MPRTYNCKRCGDTHEPPTGKQCSRIRQQEQNIAGQADGVMPMLLELKEQFQVMSQQMAQMQNKDSSSANDDSYKDSEADLEQSEPEEQGAVGGQPATASTLRQDVRIMSQAARRLARLRLDDSDDDDMENYNRRESGKKSGSVLTPTDKIKKQIDWPHMHIQRMFGGRSKNVSYADLRIDEFVYGFMSMIESPQCKWNYRVMTKILKNLMQDSMEFSWSNALMFYQMAGVQVEKGQLQWSDEARIHEMRMQYARTVFPEALRQPKEPVKPQLQAAPANMKCCISFQRKECEQDRDHTPFTHACAYCFKAKAALCRHSEEDCKRKMTDSKNGKPREQ